MKRMSDTRLNERTTIEMQYWKITNLPPRSISCCSWSRDMFSIPRMFIGTSSTRPCRRSFFHRQRPVEHGEAQRRVADSDQVVVLQVAARQADAVDEGAVPAGEILDRVLPLADDVTGLAADRVRADAGDVERLPLQIAFDDREVDRFPSQRRRFAKDALRGALQSRLVDRTRSPRIAGQQGFLRRAAGQECLRSPGPGRQPPAHLARRLLHRAGGGPTRRIGAGADHAAAGAAARSVDPAGRGRAFRRPLGVDRLLLADQPGTCRAAHPGSHFAEVIRRCAHCHPLRQLEACQSSPRDFLDPERCSPSSSAISFFTTVPVIFDFAANAPFSSSSRTSTPCLPAGTERTCVTVPDFPFVDSNGLDRTVLPSTRTIRRPAFIRCFTSTRILPVGRSTEVKLAPTARPARARRAASRMCPISAGPAYDMAHSALIGLSDPMVSVSGMDISCRAAFSASRAASKDWRGLPVQPAARSEAAGTDAPAMLMVPRCAWWPDPPEAGSPRSPSSRTDFPRGPCNRLTMAQFTPMRAITRNATSAPRRHWLVSVNHGDATTVTSRPPSVAGVSAPAAGDSSSTRCARAASISCPVW